MARPLQDVESSAKGYRDRRRKRVDEKEGIGVNHIPIIRTAGDEGAR